MRVCLFTDTLGDINGVSRFIRTVADHAGDVGLDVQVLASTRFGCPRASNVHNLWPRMARPMPGYPGLEVVWPDGRALRRLADGLAPDVVHVSTPGPVGMVGRSWAMRRGVPLVGTYHTDFPAYIEHLFDDRVLTWACVWWMRRFYAPFARVLTRSDAYVGALGRIGVAPERVERLAAGIDTEAFGPSHRDAEGTVWAGVAGARRESLKVLYAGRVSAEKNLPWLVRVWRASRAELAARGVDAQLIVVGDGPYRVEMERALAGTGSAFAGFRQGPELSALYASSDLFVFPSLTDTLGQAVLEAQASGLPAIVSDRGGPAGIVEHGGSGFVLPASEGGHAGAWVRAISELACDAGQRQRLGGRGAAKVASMSFSRSAEHFREVHERVAALAHAAGGGKIKTPGRIPASGR